MQGSGVAKPGQCLIVPGQSITQVWVQNFSILKWTHGTLTTKLCRGCMQQCQQEKSQFCTAPARQLTKKLSWEPILVTEKCRWIFFCMKHGMISITHLYPLLLVVLNSCARATAVSCYATDAGQRQIWLMWNMYTQQWLAILDPHGFVVFHFGQLQYWSRTCDHTWS